MMELELRPTPQQLEAADAAYHARPAPAAPSQEQLANILRRTY